ncbi:sugar ABC transporter permease [Streptomyces sp. NPDC058685]|uniref:sugar ABC transporter permease n=1 Tax=Streptomyces sp. NPDC058685 TaxID=3346598 RepID=UPI00364902F6
MTSTGWADAALTAVIDRVTVTASEVGARFPLFADPDSGRWTTTGRGSWTGGFWAGLLWLRARYTGAEADRAAASRCTARLAPWADADTAARGLILWYGTALASHDAKATALRERAARACLEAVDPELGLVPWGSALGGPRLLARADGVPGMVPLLAAAGPEGAAAAGAHLHRHLELCLGVSEHRPWTQPAWRFDAGSGWQPCEDPPRGWSRGRAWLLLAVADALHLPTLSGPRAEPLPGAAERLLEHGAALDGPLVPRADASRPDMPLDTSAAAITAVALLKLARLPGPRATEFAHRATAILRHLVGTHLSGPHARRPAGMLLDGCYDAVRGTAVRHELIWGDFFLGLGLAALTGSADITDV